MSIKKSADEKNKKGKVNNVAGSRLVENKIDKRLTFITWLIILGTWYVITRMGVFSSTLVPSPQRVWSTFLEILKNGYNKNSLFMHLGASFRRLFLAMFFAVITSIPLGLLSGYSNKVKSVADSIVEFYRPLPPLAYYTLLVLWFGIDDTSKVILLFLAGFAPIYIACVSAVTKINEDYILSAKSLGADKRKVFFKIVLPACMPEIFTGIRTSMGVAYTTLVSAEMVAATSGIGWMVLDASNFLKSDVIFVGVLIMGLTGITIDYGLRYLEKKIVYWKGYV